MAGGWRAFPRDRSRLAILFKNNRDGTFTDVTAKAGLVRSGWGQGCCVGDYDNDGHDDLFVSYYGQNALFHNNGDGTFTDVTAKAGLTQAEDALELRLRISGLRPRRPPGSVRRQLHRSRSENRAAAGVGALHLQGNHGGVRAAGAAAGKNILYHNNGDGTFTDVSQKAGCGTPSGTTA